MSFVAVPSYLVTVFAYLHILSAIGWLGGAILFVSSVAPMVRRMSPPATLEFLATVVPRVTRFFLIIATSTVISGPLLLLTIPDFSPILQVGIVLGLAAYLVALFTIWTFTKLTKTAKEMVKGGRAGPPPPEFLQQLKVGGIGTATIVLLLTVTLMFMVFSGYPF